MVNTSEFIASETGTIFSYLVEINHSSFGSPIRKCSDNQDISYGGNTYSASNLNVTLLQDSSGVVSGSVLQIENISGEIREALKGLYTQPSVKIGLYSSLGALEMGFYEMDVTKVSYSPTMATMYLKTDLGLDNEYPSKRFDRSYGGLVS